MSTKKLMWLGFAVGSTVGGFIPDLWGESMFSAAAIVLSLVGGIAGMWAGYKAGQSLS